MGRATLPSLMQSQEMQVAVTRRAWTARAHVYMGFLMSIVGTGVLSIPYTFALLPPEQCVVGICAVAIGMASTSFALLQAQVKATKQEESDKPFETRPGDKFGSLQELATRAGGKALGYLAAFVTAGNVYGGTIGNIQVVRDLTPHVLELVVGGVSEDVEVLVLCGIFAFMVFPLCLLQKLSALKVVNYLSFLLVLVLIGAVGYRAAYPSVMTTEDHDINVATDMDAGSDSNFVRLTKALSIYNFAFTMQLNLLPLFVELRETDPAGSLQATRSRLAKCIVGSAGLCALLYILFGLCATSIYPGNAIKGNILLNLQNDKAMNVPLVAVFLIVAISYPVHFYPLRAVIEDICLRPQKKGTKVRLLERAVVVGVLLMTQVAIALYVRGVETIFSLVGATGALCVCYAIPVTIFLLVCPPWKSLVKLLRATALIVLVAVMTITSAVVIVYIFT